MSESPLDKVEIPIQIISTRESLTKRILKYFSNLPESVQTLDVLLWKDNCHHTRSNSIHHRQYTGGE